MIFVTIVFTSMCSADSRQIFSVPSAMISRFHPKCLIVSSMNVSISIYGVETRTNVEKRVLSDSNFSAHPKLIIGRFHLLARWPAASQTSSHTGPAAKKGMMQLTFCHNVACKKIKIRFVLFRYFSYYTCISYIYIFFLHFLYSNFL